VRNHHEELTNHRGASDLFIWKSGDPFLHAELQPEERQQREEKNQSQDLAAQTWPSTPATGHDDPYKTTTTTTTPRSNIYTPAATPHPTPANRAAGGEGEKLRKAREDSQGRGGERRGGGNEPSFRYSQFVCTIPILLDEMHLRVTM
jgi:hypothetical protein